MKPSTLLYTAVGLLSPIATLAIELNPEDPGTHLAPALALAFTSKPGLY